MLYDQAQLLASSIDFALLSDPSAPGLSDADRSQRESDRSVCFDLAADILRYVLRDLKTPQGGFFGAEDADSAPAPGMIDSVLGPGNVTGIRSPMDVVAHTHFGVWRNESVYCVGVCSDCKNLPV